MLLPCGHSAGPAGRGGPGRAEVLAVDTEAERPQAGEGRPDAGRRRTGLLC